MCVTVVGSACQGAVVAVHRVGRFEAPGVPVLIMRVEHYQLFQVWVYVEVRPLLREYRRGARRGVEDQNVASESLPALFYLSVAPSTYWRLPPSMAFTWKAVPVGVPVRRVSNTDIFLTTGLSPYIKYPFSLIYSNTDPQRNDLFHRRLENSSSMNPSWVLRVNSDSAAATITSAANVLRRYCTTCG